jgi:hypothetical protein
MLGTPEYWGPELQQRIQLLRQAHEEADDESI